jgi:hypothetical protein
MSNDRFKAAIVAAIDVPDHITACARACYYDLMHGPSWSRIPQGDVARFTVDDYGSIREDMEDESESGDLIEETYTGKVGDALRAFIDNLPSQCWIDCDSDCYSESEPESSYQDDEGEWHECYLDDTCQLDRSDIVAALFGQTISREFR